jgi:hypothetical protein
MELKTSFSEFCICLGVATSGDNVMAHFLPGFLASWLGGTAGLQTDLPHFSRPLPVMVTAARRLPVGLLPDMRHFMGKRREDHFVRPTGKTVRVEGKLMNCGLIDAAVKPLRGKVTSRLRVALQCHQHLGQAPLEQCTVEKVISLLETLIFGFSKSFCLHDCIVPYNLYIVKRQKSIHDEAIIEVFETGFSLPRAQSSLARLPSQKTLSPIASHAPLFFTSSEEYLYA